MVPSPDWFIGLDSLNLCQGGHFVDSLTMEVGVDVITIIIIMYRILIIISNIIIVQNKTQNDHGQTAPTLRRIHWTQVQTTASPSLPQTGRQRWVNWVIIIIVVIIVIVVIIIILIIS